MRERAREVQEYPAVIVFCLQLCVNKNTSRYARFFIAKRAIIPSFHPAIAFSIHLMQRFVNTQYL